MMNLISKNKNVLKLKIGFIACSILFTTSCDNKYKDGFQQFEYEGGTYPYIAYNNLTKNKLEKEMHGGDAYFLYPIDYSLYYIRIMSHHDGQKNFGFPIEDGTNAGGGTFTIKNGLLFISSSPISIPVNIKETRSWVGPGPFKEKCTATYGKPDKDSVNINIECIEDSEPVTGIPGRDIAKATWNSKRGLTYYSTLSEGRVSKMQLKSQNGLFSPKFFEFYRTKSREIAAQTKSTKPADVIPDIVY
jgi:hypothetical protein